MPSQYICNDSALFIPFHDTISIKFAKIDQKFTTFFAIFAPTALQTGICRCNIISLSCYLPILDHHIILGQIYFRNHSYFSARQSRFVLVWTEKSQRSIDFLSPYHAFLLAWAEKLQKEAVFLSPCHRFILLWTENSQKKPLFSAHVIHSHLFGQKNI